MSQTKKILTVENFSSYYPSQQISFRVWDKKRSLLPWVSFAFVKEFVLNVLTDDLFSIQKDKDTYEIVWDCDPSSLVPFADGSLSLIISFQLHATGQRFAVARPLLSSLAAQRKTKLQASTKE